MKYGARCKWKQSSEHSSCCLFSPLPLLCFVAFSCISTKLIGCSFMQTWAWVESWSQAAPGQPRRGPATPLMGEYESPPHIHTYVHPELITRSVFAAAPLSATQLLHLSFPINAALFVISAIPAVCISCYWFQPKVQSLSVNVLIYLLMQCTLVTGADWCLLQAVRRREQRWQRVGLFEFVHAFIGLNFILCFET